ncbi:brachyurin-like [Schistocerca cancellata]|uniref:brachyurin-like n=1 Tax=Schistocerca cancellata TaxID=274614 RepID=UPI0021179E09|nr:brachyurin-like [Schistocerca cancellata]
MGTTSGPHHGSFVNGMFDGDDGEYGVTEGGGDDGYFDITGYLGTTSGPHDGSFVNGMVDGGDQEYGDSDHDADVGVTERDDVGDAGLHRVPASEFDITGKLPSTGKHATYIVNGQQAKLGQFPYQVSVKGDRRMICGGSLISEKAVLTAAHCTNSFKSFDLRMGGIHMVESESSAWTAVSSSAKRHPRYNSTGDVNNDVAIFLPEEAPLSEYIKLVALPSFAEINETFVGQNALVSGWGLTGDSVILKSTLCANSEDSDVCQGDSGGALVLKTATGYKQIGVSSFGSPAGCHTPTPSAFARVTSFLDWITKTAEISV